MYCPNCSEQISEKAEICPKCGVRPFKIKNYCYNCGKQVNEHQDICIDCGVSLKKLPQGSAANNAKDPWLVALLSFLITGLGQMLVGQVKKGATILIGSMVLAMFTFGLSAIFTTAFSVIDGYLIGKKVKEGKEVGEWEFF